MYITDRCNASRDFLLVFVFEEVGLDKCPMFESAATVISSSPQDFAKEKLRAP